MRVFRKQTWTIACVVLMICNVAFVSYWPLFHELRVEDTWPLLPGHTALGGGIEHSPKFQSRKQVTWLHMHKFGGTFITKMAGLQGEEFPPGNINANWMPDFCSTPQGQRILCAERTKPGSPRSAITWSAIERELDEGDFCEGAIMGTMLREPLSALQSVLSHDRFDKVAVLRTLEVCAERAPAKHFMYQPPSIAMPNVLPCLPAWDTYQHFDNFATRTLAGAYSQPPCGITTSHLEAAKSQLQRMDVITILEELTEHMPQLQDTFHWNISLVQPWKRVNRHPGEQAHKSVDEFTMDEMALLKRANAIDLELYQFAVSLARNMSNTATDSILKKGDLLLSPGEDSRAVNGMLAVRQRVAARLSLRGRPLAAAKA